MVSTITISACTRNPHHAKSAARRKERTLPQHRAAHGVSHHHVHMPAKVIMQVNRAFAAACAIRPATQ